MPNYDIIPLAVDLLDYTIQRVKTKEPEYRKVKALVQENGQLAERELFEKIRDDGKPHFPKSQTFHLCARYGKKPLVGAAMTETVRRLCVRQSVPMNLLK